MRKMLFSINNIFKIIFYRANKQYFNISIASIQIWVIIFYSKLNLSPLFEKVVIKKLFINIAIEITSFFIFNCTMNYQNQLSSFECTNQKVSVLSPIQLNEIAQQRRPTLCSIPCAVPINSSNGHFKLSHQKRSASIESRPIKNLELAPKNQN